VQQQLQLSEPTARPYIVTGSYSTGLPAASLQTTPTSSPPAPPRLVVHSSGRFSSISTRRPHISSNSPATSNLRSGNEIRAPAPHLHHFRPSARGMHSQQVSTSPTPSEIPSRGPATAQQSSPQTTTNSGESMGISPSMTSLQGLESLMDIDNQTSTNATQSWSSPTPTDLSSDSNPLAQPKLSMLNSVLTNPTSEVVCLSDDD